MNKEPAVTVGGGIAVLGALIALFTAFGGSLTQEQTAAITGLALVVLPLLQAAITRAKVYAPATVALLKARFGVQDLPGPDHRA